MIKRLLVAYDGSRQAEKAFTFALDVAGKYAAGLIVLAVARPPEPPVAVETEAVIDHATRYYQEKFDGLQQRAAEAGVESKFEIRVGHPAEQIVLLADEAGVDLIVMGHRGESFFQRWLLGSVAKRVLSYARCAVTVVR
ncbi:MAG: universal stress protein [Thermodesulfobacteriota bacterium]